MEEVVLLGGGGHCLSVLDSLYGMNKYNGMIVVDPGLEVGSFITAGIECYYGHVSLTFFVAMTYYIYRYTWLIEEIEDFTIRNSWPRLKKTFQYL